MLASCMSMAFYLTMHRLMVNNIVDTIIYQGHLARLAGVMELPKLGNLREKFLWDLDRCMVGPLSFNRTCG